MRVLKAVQFVALVSIAILLIPLGAHLFELPHKIGLPPRAYFAVQQLYRGWAWFGIDMLVALGSTVLLVVMLRHGGPSFWFAIGSMLCIAASLAIFLHWTLPANRATLNWTSVPADWQALRSAWEHSHAASAVVVFAGFCSALLSTLTCHTGRAASHRE